MQGPEPIVIVTTGGTIDKAYFDALSTYQIGEPVVKKVLDTANVTHPYRIVELLRKDSLELTDEDRQRLKETVAALDSRRVVITHGTDTMTDSAAVLAAIPGKTIVLTGACRRPASATATRLSISAWRSPLSRHCRRVSTSR
jgi:L-asparaginase